MSETTENKPSFDLILSKFGLILSNVKDSIIKDFLDGLVKDGSYDEFVKKFENPDYKALEDFVSAIIKKIGYDISGAEECGELYNVVVSIIDTSKTLSDKITELFGEEWPSFDEIVAELPDEKESGGAEGASENSDDSSKKFIKIKKLLDTKLDGYSGVEFGSDKFGGSIELDEKSPLNRLKAAFELIQKLFDLFKKLSDIEWNKIADETGDFGKFIKQNYITEEFAKRLVDYVLITFLKNAQDVFVDSLDELLDCCKDSLWENLGDNIKSIVSKEKYDELWGTLKEYKEQLRVIESQPNLKIGESTQENATSSISTKKVKRSALVSTLTSGAEGALSDVSEEIKGFTKGQLESYKKVIQQKIDTLLEKIAPDYMSVADIMTRTYAVLEFLGVIGTKKIDLASYAHYLSIKGKSIDDVIDLEPVEVEIPSFHWNRVEKLFTKPVDYLQDVFPVKDHKDLENVIIKVTNLVHAFNKDFPQFDSIKQLLWDLIIRINDKIAPMMEAEASEAYNAIKEKYEAIKQFLVDLLKACEAFAIEAKETLTQEFKELASQITTDANSFYKSVNDVWNQILNSKEVSFVVTDDLKKIVKDTFEAAAKEKFSEFCDETKIEQIGSQIEKAANDLYDCSKTFVDSVKGDIEKLFDADTWKEHFSNVVNELQDELKKQTKNVPDSLEELKEFGTASLDKLLKLETPTNPFSDFDPAAFYKIIVDNLSCPVDVNFKSHYDTFKKTFDEKLNGDNGLIKSLLNAVEQSGQNADILTRDLLQCWWNKIQARFENVFLNPFEASLKDEVVAWIAKVLANIVDAVKDLISGSSSSTPKTTAKLAKSARSAKSTKTAISAQTTPPIQPASTDSSGSLDIFNQDFLKDLDIDAVANLISDIAGWEDFDADSWKSWGNVIKFAVNLYKVIPAEIKQYVSELIDFPDLSTINKYLPEYSFDAKNKFLAVTVWDKKAEEKDKTYAGKVGINIQLLIFIGEMKKEESDDKDGEAKDDSVKEKEQGDSVKQEDGSEKEKTDSEKTEEKEEGIFILPVVKGNFGVNFNIGEKHCMSFSATPSLNAGVKKPGDDDKDKKPEGKTEGEAPKQEAENKGTENKGTEGSAKKEDESKGNVVSKNVLGCFIKLSDKISATEVKWLADEGAADAELKLSFERGQVNDKGEIKPIPDKDDPNKVEKVSIFDTKIASLSIENYPQTFFASYKESKFDIGYSCELKKLLLALKLKEQNDFFKTILKDDVEIELEKLKLQYSLQKGFEVEDSLKVRIPINKEIDLDVVKFKNLAIDLGLDGNDLLASLKTSFIADLKGVTVTFTDMGLGVDCKLPFNGQKDFDISPKFTYPNGIGISIDVEGVKGGGAIQWDEERERFFGGLELTVVEKFGAEAVLVFTTGKGTDPFSLMGALCVYFDPGIQLGMGFSLEGIGGSFGYNRMLCVDSLRDSVYDGTLESALFFKDVTKNVDRVLANIDKFYPIKIGQMYFGFLGKIAWGSILKAQFGLFIQAPNPVTIIIAGVVKVSVSESADKLLVINACFMGGIQFDKGIFFDASLYDSKIVGLELYGDMALRIYWGGETKGFILSVGGFHPQYKPEAGFNLPDLRRVGLKLDYKILKMSLEAYFAITSNTVQFGTSLDMRIGWDEFSLTGYAVFNALFQFNPFKFIVDMAAGLAVKVGSKKICSIDLAFELGGPAQWHAKGKATIKILFIKVSVHFDQTWGKKQVASDRKRIDILPLFTKELTQKNNWKFISSDLTDNMVSLVQFDEKSFVLQPSDTISFSQSAVPLNTEIKCYGEDDVNDYGKIRIASIKIGSNYSIKQDNIESEYASFAPSLIENLDDQQKLTQPSFKLMDSGFKLSAGFDEKDGSKHETVPAYEEEYTITDEKVERLSVKTWRSLASNQESTIAIPKTNAESNSEENHSSNRRYSKITRGSSRRSASGFNRFVNQLDEYWCDKIKNISKV